MTTTNVPNWNPTQPQDWELIMEKDSDYIVSFTGFNGKRGMIYFPKSPSGAVLTCSIILQAGSRGWKEGLYEAWASWYEDEPQGWLTPNDVTQYLIKCYQQSQQQ
jgi:hypothetical protein